MMTNIIAICGRIAEDGGEARDRVKISFNFTSGE